MTVVSLAPGEEEVWNILKEIPDPEIPTINLVDLGVIHSVVIHGVNAGPTIRIAMLPTFVGCPALDMMQRDIKARLESYGEVEVAVIFDDVWSSDRISEAGREMLKEAGLAPPPRGDMMSILDGLTELPLHTPPAACPHCGSSDTRQESMFGPTPCRSIYYCNGCHQPFERFKAL